MTKLPRVIYLQIFGDAPRSEDIPPVDQDTTWSVDKIFDSDVRYVIDKRQVRKRRKVRK